MPPKKFPFPNRVIPANPLRMLPRIYFIRHGETDWSLAGRYTGRTDLPLTTRGEERARALGQRLQGITFAHVFTSPRQRARRTCELVLPGRVPELEPDLAEWDYGNYEGQLSAVVHSQHPEWNLFQDGCPNGESPSQISLRTERVIAKLRALGGNIALFSHGHFGRVLAARWIGLPVREAQHFLLGTASLSILDYEHDRADAPVIARWNEASDAASLSK